MAEKWEVNADATEFTFTIKQGQTFSNGDPVLPSSFKYAWVRNGQADFASPLRLPDRLRQGRRRPAGRHGHQPRQLDRGRRHGHDPQGHARVAAGRLPVDRVATRSSARCRRRSCRKLDRPDRVEQDGIMIGNGPFKMEAPANDQEVVLVRNDTWAGNVYGDKQAKLDKIIFKISARTPESAYTDFEAGNLDTATIPSGQYADAQAKYGNTVNVAAARRRTTSTSVRRSRSSAARRTSSCARPSRWPSTARDQPEGVRGRPRRSPPASRLPASPASRRTSATTASTTRPRPRSSSTSGRPTATRLSGPITIDFNTGRRPRGRGRHHPGEPEGHRASSRRTTRSSEKYFSTMADGGCHFCRSGWYADYPTYGNFMFDLFSTASIGRQQPGLVRRPAVRRHLVNQAQAELDDTKRAELYQQAEDYLLNDRHRRRPDQLVHGRPGVPRQGPSTTTSRRWASSSGRRSACKAS